MAASAIARHAIPEDVPIVRRAIVEQLDADLEGDQYLICSLAEALAHHPELGPFDELRRACEEMPYSYGRHFVVDALAATDPAFPHTTAIDCLWDAEPHVRATAARVADRGDPV